MFDHWSKFRSDVFMIKSLEFREQGWGEASHGASGGGHAISPKDPG